jgi:Fe-S cluster biogenesis protein NfuA
MILTEPTPNPNAVKFLPGRTVLGTKPPKFYQKENEAPDEAPLVEQLFAIEGVKDVFFGSDFITVGKTDDHSWDVVKSNVLNTIDDYNNTGDAFVLDKPEPACESINSDVGVDKVTKKIVELLDTRVRPAVAMDGGDILFHSFEDGVVYLEMYGACSGCPSSTMTLKMGIENMLRHYIPEVQRVEPI